MKPEAAVAISGGIDSLVAAFLLKKKYNNIVGLHFFNGYEQGDFTFSGPADAATRKKDLPVAIVELPETHPLNHIARQLDIPIKLVDCRQYFQTMVVDYFVQSYRKGLTPNPCMICNPIIKFGVIFDLARKMGARSFATGHYARIQINDQGYFLQKGEDELKDQSYFLALIPKEVLPFVHFPLGSMTKQQVVELAKQKKLTPIMKTESQDICFIKGGNYAQFIFSQDHSVGAPGIITDVQGRKIGTHNGLHHFTIGQRRGINCPASEPYYVQKIDIEHNRLVVGPKKDLYQNDFTMARINWFIPEPESPLAVFVKIRYRHRAAKAKLIPKTSDSALIHFEKPQPAITPGQGAVCYINDDVIAGGWIDG